MGGRTSRRAQGTLTLAAFAVLISGIAVSPALGLGFAIVAEDQTGYSQIPPEVGPGSLLLFSNQDVVTHTVTADDNGPDGKALFRTGNVSGGAQAEVKGVPFLPAGEYDFHCSIHPSTMQGVLQIGGDGPGPFPRPEIEVAVKSKKLAKVVKSGKLKVKVSAAQPTDADGVSLSAKKGRKKITKSANLNLGAGNTKTAKLKLKQSAVEKLADLDKAKVKVTGEVDFGSPAKASKKLK